MRSDTITVADVLERAHQLAPGRALVMQLNPRRVLVVNRCCGQRGRDKDGALMPLMCAFFDAAKNVPLQLWHVLPLGDTSLLCDEFTAALMGQLRVVPYFDDGPAGERVVAGLELQFLVPDSGGDTTSEMTDAEAAAAAAALHERVLKAQSFIDGNAKERVLEEVDTA